MEDSTSVRDKPRPGRPAEAVAPTMVTNVQGFVNKDSRMPLQEVAYQFSIGKASTRKIRYGRLVLGGCRNRLQKIKMLPGWQRKICGVLTIMKTSVLTVLSLRLKCRVSMLNLKQKLSQSSGNELVLHLPRSLSCLHLPARLCWFLLGFHLE